MRNPCCDRKGINKGAWSKEEDQKLIDYIRVHGEGCWRSLPKAAGLLRCGKSCRLRWINYLRPDVKRGNLKEDEADLIIRLHALLGNRWSLIAGRLPGRTDNEVKNYWNSHLRKKLVSMGFDPDNHRVLSVNASLPQSQSSRDSGGTPSSGAVDNFVDEAECWHFNYGGRPDQANSGGLFPDLNLDLTSCIPRPEGDHETTAKPTTLLLFR